MDTEDLELLDEGHRHGRCVRCQPAKLFQPFTALCGTRAMFTYRISATRIPANACVECVAFVGTICTGCGRVIGGRLR